MQPSFLKNSSGIDITPTTWEKGKGMLGIGPSGSLPKVAPSSKNISWSACRAPDEATGRFRPTTRRSWSFHHDTMHLRDYLRSRKWWTSSRRHKPGDRDLRRLASPEGCESQSRMHERRTLKTLQRQACVENMNTWEGPTCAPLTSCIYHETDVSEL